MAIALTVSCINIQVGLMTRLRSIYLGGNNMKITTIQGITANNFGSNNYSCGMEAIIFNPQDTTVEQVRILPGVFLHPTCEPNSLGIFALLGTKEQFDEFYLRCVKSEITKRVIGGNIPDMSDIEAWKLLNEKIDILVKEFVPWYNK